MRAFEIGHWHIWEANGVLVSNEDTKQLSRHASFDEAVNALWLAGEKDIARELNLRLKAKN